MTIEHIHQHCHRHMMVLWQMAVINQAGNNHFERFSFESNWGQSLDSSSFKEWSRWSSGHQLLARSVVAFVQILISSSEGIRPGRSLRFLDGRFVLQNGLKTKAPERDFNTQKTSERIRTGWKNDIQNPTMWVKLMRLCVINEHLSQARVHLWPGVIVHDTASVAEQLGLIEVICQTTLFSFVVY